MEIATLIESDVAKLAKTGLDHSGPEKEVYQMVDALSKAGFLIHEYGVDEDPRIDGNVGYVRVVVPNTRDDMSYIDVWDASTKFEKPFKRACWHATAKLGLGGRSLLAQQVGNYSRYWIVTWSTKARQFTKAGPAVHESDVTRLSKEGLKHVGINKDDVKAFADLLRQEEGVVITVIWRRNGKASVTTMIEADLHAAPVSLSTEVMTKAEKIADKHREQFGEIETEYHGGLHVSFLFPSPGKDFIDPVQSDPVEESDVRRLANIGAREIGANQEEVRNVAKWLESKGLEVSGQGRSRGYGFVEVYIPGITETSTLGEIEQKAAYHKARIGQILDEWEGPDIQLAAHSYRGEDVIHIDFQSEGPDFTLYDDELNMESVEESDLNRLANIGIRKTHRHEDEVLKVATAFASEGLDVDVYGRDKDDRALVMFGNMIDLDEVDDGLKATDDWLEENRGALEEIVKEHGVFTGDPNIQIKVVSPAVVSVKWNNMGPQFTEWTDPVNVDPDDVGDEVGEDPGGPVDEGIKDLVKKGLPNESVFGMARVIMNAGYEVTGIGVDILSIANPNEVKMSQHVDVLVPGIDVNDPIRVRLAMFSKLGDEFEREMNEFIRVNKKALTPKPDERISAHKVGNTSVRILAMAPDRRQVNAKRWHRCYRKDPLKKGEDPLKKGWDRGDPVFEPGGGVNESIGRFADVGIRKSTAREHEIEKAVEAMIRRGFYIAHWGRRPKTQDGRELEETEAYIHFCIGNGYKGEWNWINRHGSGLKELLRPFVTVDFDRTEKETDDQYHKAFPHMRKEGEKRLPDIRIVSIGTGYATVFWNNSGVPFDREGPTSEGFRDPETVETVRFDGKRGKKTQEGLKDLVRAGLPNESVFAMAKVFLDADYTLTGLGYDITNADNSEAVEGVQYVDVLIPEVDYSDPMPVKLSTFSKFSGAALKKIHDFALANSGALPTDRPTSIRALKTNNTSVRIEVPASKRPLANAHQWRRCYRRDPLNKGEDPSSKGEYKEYPLGESIRDLAKHGVEASGFNKEPILSMARHFNTQWEISAAGRNNGSGYFEIRMRLVKPYPSDDDLYEATMEFLDKHSEAIKRDVIEIAEVANHTQVSVIYNIPGYVEVSWPSVGRDFEDELEWEPGTFVTEGLKDLAHHGIDKSNHKSEILRLAKRLNQFWAIDFTGRNIPSRNYPDRGHAYIDVVVPMPDDVIHASDMVEPTSEFKERNGDRIRRMAVEEVGLEAEPEIFDDTPGFLTVAWRSSGPEFQERLGWPVGTQHGLGESKGRLDSLIKASGYVDSLSEIFGEPQQQARTWQTYRAKLINARNPDAIIHCFAVCSQHSAKVNKEVSGRVNLNFYVGPESEQNKGEHIQASIRIGHAVTLSNFTGRLKAFLASLSDLGSRRMRIAKLKEFKRSCDAMTKRNIAADQKK